MCARARARVCVCARVRASECVRVCVCGGGGGCVYSVLFQSVLLCSLHDLFLVCSIDNNLYHYVYASSNVFVFFSALGRNVSALNKRPSLSLLLLLKAVVKKCTLAAVASRVQQHINHCCANVLIVSPTGKTELMSRVKNTNCVRLFHLKNCLSVVTVHLSAAKFGVETGR